MLPKAGFEGGVEVNARSPPPGSVGPVVGSVGPVLGSVGPVVGSVGLTVGAVDSSVPVGTDESGADGVDDGVNEGPLPGPSFRPWCEPFGPWWPFGLPPSDGPTEDGAWLSCGGEPTSAALWLPPRCAAP